MSDRWAVLTNGVCDNVIIWDGEADYTPPEGSTLKRLADGTPAGPGWRWAANNRWVHPDEESAPDPSTPVAMTVDPAALATFVQAVADPTVDTRQALADFAAAISTD